MNIKSDMNDITIDYYRVENFNDINSQAPFMFNGFLVYLNTSHQTRARMFYEQELFTCNKMRLINHTRMVKL